jgi:chromosome partitioning protein
MILLCAGEKGGTGKTTLAAHLGIERAKRGSKVVWVDADPGQATLTKHAAVRIENGIEPSLNVFQVQGSSAGNSIRALAKDYQDVIIDCGGYDSAELRQSLLVCDKWVIPLNPTLFQVFTLGNLNDLLQAANGFRGEHALIPQILGMRLSVNSLSRSKEDLEAVMAMLEGFDLLKTVVHQRSAFEKAERLGMSVTELEKKSESDRKAASSILSLHDEIFGS